MVRLFAAAALAAFVACAAYVLWLPDVRPLEYSNPKTTAYIELSRRQARAHGWRYQPKMTWVPWDEISDNLKHAVMTSEDDTFYRHHGVDWDSVEVAATKDWEKKRLVYGASTITQQLARNLYLSPSKNPLRKLKEMLIARRLERVLGKRRIFELYLNVAQWGKGIYGCEAASQAYFGKPCADLSPEEAVAMAVILPSPDRHNPAKGGRYVERNMRRIIARMRRSGYWPEEEDYKLASFFAYGSTDAVAGSSITVVTAAPVLVMPSSGPYAGRNP